jgi:hypothetical protein
MKAIRLKVFASSLFVLLASCAVASAQTVAGGNGDFGTPTSSSTPWGTSADGPQTVNWTTDQYAYDPYGSVAAGTSGISGWSFTGGAGVQQNGSAWGFANAPVGGQSAFLQSYDGGIGVPKGTATDPSSISTTLSGLTKGDAYTLTFYMASRGGYGLNPIIVSSLGGQSYQVTSPPSTGLWSAYSIVFTASSSSEVLTVDSTFPSSGNYDNDTGVADLSITAGTNVIGSEILAPEGGAAGLYLVLAGAVCFGAMFLSSSNRFGSSASA